MASGLTTTSDRFFATVKWVGLVESVTCNVTVRVPAEVGVPLMTPVVALIVNPAGKFVTAQVYGLVPPVAAKVAPYDVPVIAGDNELVVIVSGATTAMVSVFVAVRRVGLVESVTVIVTVLVPSVVGVPVIAPVEALSARPAGRPIADQVYGAFPPVAASVAAYDVP